MKYKIVQGNTVFLHVLVDKLDVSKEYNRLVPCDMSKAENIKVELLGGFFSDFDTELEWELSGINNNELICTVPGTLEMGRYTIKVSWTLDGVAMTSVEKRILQIVSHNDRSKLPIGTVEGETAGLFNLRYYLVTENQSYCPIHYILDNVSSENTETLVKNGESYSTVLDASFGLDDVRVIMNGKDVTDEVYDGATGKVDIPAVSGYVIIHAASNSGSSLYGASSADGISDLDTTSFKTTTVSTGETQEVSITTTEEKPYIWFVLRPKGSYPKVAFTQNGFEETLHSAKLNGDTYYYWTDKLAPSTYTYSIVCTQGPNKH